MDSGDRVPRVAAERAVPNRFESFALAIVRVGEVYRAQVERSPVGRQSAVQIDTAGLDPAAPEEASLDTTRDVRRASMGLDDLRLIGERLFRAVFVDAVAEAYRASVERVRSDGVGLRISIQLDETPELVPLPWEALWDPSDRAFLADQPDLPVVRTLGVAATMADPQGGESPLRMLALLPEPYKERKISGAEEWLKIQQHLKLLVERGELVAETLQPPTLGALGRRMEGEGFHILHIVAHGGRGEPGRGGMLRLEDKDGQLDEVSGAALARALERNTAPSLVVLNACHAARISAASSFDGLAQHLMRRGIPAVVAMRTAISDAAAVAFAGAFYAELAGGETIEAAMVKGRRVLSLGAHRAEWATPSLYLRRENVRIFQAVSPVSERHPQLAGRQHATGIGFVGKIGGFALLVLLLWWLAGFIWPSEDVRMLRAGNLWCPPPAGLQELRFVKIEPGLLDLGASKVTVEEAYCISTKEVTRRDWLAVIGGELSRAGRPLDWPMTDVSPDRALEFLRQLEARDPGASYALPTSTQWEYAARAGRKTTYFFGDDADLLEKFGNCRNILGRDGFDGPAPVGSFKANPWGLYDVHGNVAEWVDWPDEDWLPTESGALIATRLGGSYEHAVWGCSFPGSRSEVSATEEHRPDTGIRVVRLLAIEEDS